jgi:hypothetical protein
MLQRNYGSTYFISESAALQSGTGFVELKIESGLSSGFYSGQTDSGKYAQFGYFVNDGPGNTKLKLQPKGGASGAAFTLKSGETFNLQQDYALSSLHYSYSGTSGNYRAFFA